MSLFQKDGEDAVRCCHIGCNALIGWNEWNKWREGDKSDWYNLRDHMIVACPEHAAIYSKLIGDEDDRTYRRNQIEEWYVERARKRILAAFDAKYPEATFPEIQDFFIDDDKQ